VSQAAINGLNRERMVLPLAKPRTSARPAVALGVVSYGIYLWHETWMLKILAWLHRPLFQTGFLKLTLGVSVLAIGSAAASYVIVEQPFQRFLPLFCLSNVFNNLGESASRSK